jgi:hypothetical protein
MSSDLDRQATVIARAATDLDQWAAEWAERWPEDKLTPLGMGDLAIDLRALLPEPPCEVAVRVATKVRGRAAFLEWTCELPSGHEGQHQDEDSGPWSVEDATPARPEPRVWNAGDPEPEGVERVCGRVAGAWIKRPSGKWRLEKNILAGDGELNFYSQPKGMQWAHLLDEYGPLTEVRAGGAR